MASIPSPAAPHPPKQPFGVFAARLRDLLSTIESTALLSAADARVRGLGEHLRFACLSLPCAEALVALELSALGKLSVPVVAGPDAFRICDLHFPPTGTPFAYLLSGGGGYAAELTEDDPMLEVLMPALSAPPRHGIFVPIRVGDTTVGGAALLSHEKPFPDKTLDMAERLAEVLGLTVESFRTERVLFELFARALPDLLADDALTSLRPSLTRFLHTLRVMPAYQRRLSLALAIGRVADKGEAETELAVDILNRIADYARRFEGEADPSGGFGEFS